MTIENPRDEVLPDAVPAPLRYAYRASLIGAAHQFELTEEGLSWQVSGKSGLWRYADITEIILSYRPVSMQSQRFRAEIECTGRQRLAIFSTSRQTISLMAPQGRDYRAFIAQLHERMKAAGSKAVLIGGIGRKIYAVGFAFLVLVGVALAGLFIRAVATGEFSGALFLAGFAAWFIWQIGGFMSRNRPRTYTFDHLPEALLP